MTNPTRHTHTLSPADPAPCATVSASRRVLPRTLLCTLLLVAWPSAALDLDICGCVEHPESLGHFDTGDPASWSPELAAIISKTSDCCQEYLTLTLPDDGVLVFESIRVRFDDSVFFRRNAANTPVTLLVAGDVTLDGSQSFIYVDGGAGGSGNTARNGKGGGPGPGGFRGGDGAYLAVTGLSGGGDGLGAGGGGAGLGYQHGGNGAFTGNRTLLPLSGGSGGGGGGSITTSGRTCSAGGGGAGGGAILLAVNGRLTVSGPISADGGNLGGPTDGACAGNGGSGSGGAIRIVATEVRGNGGIYARGGNSRNNDGVIRIESPDDAYGTKVDPPAIRTRALGPITNAVATQVAITEVDGAAVPDPLTGSVGGIDVVLPAPGTVTFTVETSGVPGGTLIDVAVKPELGGRAVHTEALLAPGDCGLDGRCTTSASFDLASGAYFVEATATFQTP